jgi:hypothetical protein
MPRGRHELRDSRQSSFDRYYDPGTGQFLSVDPLVDETEQPCAYTVDDPVNGVELMGLSDCGWNPACYAVSGVYKATTPRLGRISASLWSIRGQSHGLANGVPVLVAARAQSKRDLHPYTQRETTARQWQRGETGEQ